MKTLNASEIYWFKKREARACDSARARERECDILAPSPSHSRDFKPCVFKKGINFRHVWSFHVKTKYLVRPV